MSITYLKVKVSNPQFPDEARVFRFLVDSGAIYTVMPEAELKQQGIRATSTREFILANGQEIEMPVGNAFFEYKGKIGAAPVVFGDEGIYLLGATTLEALGMILDPIHRELKPLPITLM